MTGRGPTAKKPASADSSLLEPMIAGKYELRKEGYSIILMVIGASRIKYVLSCAYKKDPRISHDNSAITTDLVPSGRGIVGAN